MYVLIEETNEVWMDENMMCPFSVKLLDNNISKIWEYLM
jgi:hypothetical protein